MFQGYIVMASENAMQNYEGSRRDKLFQFYFGKKEKDIRRQDGVEFVLLDFDYLATSPTDGELLCDFYCSSTNGRSDIWQKLPKSGSSRFQNSEYGGVRAAANEQVNSLRSLFITPLLRGGTVVLLQQIKKICKTLR